MLADPGPRRLPMTPRGHTPEPARAAPAGEPDPAARAGAHGARGGACTPRAAQGAPLVTLLLPPLLLPLLVLLLLLVLLAAGAGAAGAIAAAAVAAAAGADRPERPHVADRGGRKRFETSAGPHRKDISLSFCALSDYSRKVQKNIIALFIQCNRFY